MQQGRSEIAARTGENHQCASNSATDDTRQRAKK